MNKLLSIILLIGFPVILSGGNNSMSYRQELDTCRKANLVKLKYINYKVNHGDSTKLR